jgi:glycine cleavage system H protein
VKPEELKYSKTHEWVAVDAATKTAVVGLSAFALEALTDLVYVELPKVGAKVKAGQSFGEIESVKAVSDLYSPVNGEVVAIHEGLAEHLDVLKTDPYGEGWMVKIKLSDDQGLGDLLSHSAYAKQCAEEHH